MTSPSEGTVPKAVERRELLVPEPAIALAGLLDIDAPASAAGDPLPPLWHWFYLLERHRQNELGPDGHAVHGIAAPPGPGRLRMFAGGRVTTLTPLKLEEQATRVTRVASTTEKQGRSGPLTVVTTQSEFWQAGHVAVIEEQDIVYRKPGSQARRKPAASEPTPTPAGDEDQPLELDVDPVLLFRFSALTYNAHRIHYDHLYTTQQEGYPDLVIHGPLQALLMAERLRRSRVSLVGKQFSYRLLAPTCGAQRLHVTHRQNGETFEVDVHDGAGVLTATASARPTGNGSCGSVSDVVACRDLRGLGPWAGEDHA